MRLSTYESLSVLWGEICHEIKTSEEKVHQVYQSNNKNYYEGGLIFHLCHLKHIFASYKKAKHESHNTVFSKSDKYNPENKHNK